ncbi:MAG: AAA family ATPase [Eggerthellaceae bacterium]|nr:AAA family ATPase [Eggerthellaceae bacterium]
MTMRKPVLCADTSSLQHPEMIGLDGEVLGAHGWLTIFSDAQQARDYARASVESLEIWVAGSDQMEGINLAAAMKHDRSDANVSLVSFSSGGSLLSRAHAAGINEVLDRGAFLNRYRLSKRACELIRSSQFSAAERVRDERIPDIQASAAHRNSPGASCGTSVDADPVWRSQSATTIPLVSSIAAQAPSEEMAASAAVCVSSSNAVAAEPVVATPHVAMHAVEPSATAVFTRSSAMHAAQGYVLTVVGAGGGTGKSTIATLVACCAQESGRKTVLVDGDLQLGDIAYLTGSESPLRVDELLDTPLRMQGLVRTGRMPAVVAAPLRMERSEYAESRFMEVVEMLRQQFDVVIINTGPTWSDLHMQLMEGSSNVLFVVDQRPSSIRACKHALELCSRCGIASKPFMFAVNRCSRKALFSSIDVSVALQGVHVYELADGGKAVEELLGTGQPFDLVDSGNALAKSVADMLNDVLPKSSSEPKEFIVPRKKRKLHMSRRRS